tara:strand:+ start:806 stop:2074 length:1269 start_codon:yes stop_codon:yes gene_type:complete
MDNFDYKSYLKSGKIYGDVNETKILKESEEISEKKYKQGYDDREDESLGARRGAEKKKKESFKARRDDSYGKFGKRDAEAKGKAKGPGKNKVNKESVEESAVGIAAGVASLLGGAVAAEKIMKKLERGDFGERGEKIADMLKSLGSAASATTQSRGFEESIEEVGKGYFKKKFGIGKKGFSMDDRKAMKETIAEAITKIQEGSYPFDQCVSDNEGRYGEEGAKRVCGAIRAAYGEGQINEMDEVSWNEKNNPTRSDAVGERDPKKVGQSTSAYAINEDKRTDAEEEGYEDGFKDAKKDMKDALSKMKVSELKNKIKEDIIEILSEQDEEVDVDVEDEVEANVDVDVEDDVNVDAEGDDINIKKRSVKADIEVGLSPTEEMVQDSLQAAMKASEALGNDVLTDQIGNTITYFTREFVVGNRTD